MGAGRTAAYVALLVAAIAGAIVLVGQGEHRHAQPAIAGGYDATAPNACLGTAPAPTGRPLPKSAPAQPPAPGASFDVLQSGQFVNLSNAARTLGGRLRLHTGTPRRLTGTVDCVGGSSQHFEGTVSPDTPTVIKGTLGGAAVEATLKRDPPDPGSVRPIPPHAIAGLYKLLPRSTCLGGAMELEHAAGGAYDLVAASKQLGRVTYARGSGAIAGDVACVRGGQARLRATASGRNVNNLTLLPLDEAVDKPSATPGKPLKVTASGLGPAGEKVSASRVREAFDKLVAAFFIAVAIVMLIARLFGILAERLGQPRVMGEVVAGLTLGPSVLGAISPQLQAQLFPSDILPAFGIAANLGLIFYMFLVGLEVDRDALRGRLGQALVISNVSIAIPMLLGIGAAIPIYELVAPDKKFAAFALFMGVAMSITAFPVLARILSERRMLQRPLGALALTCASIDDVVAWFLIALATTIAVAGSTGEVIKTVLLAIAFTVGMFVLVRPLIGRVAGAFDESGRVPPGWVTIIFAGVVLSAWLTDEIGIAVIFGGFIMGMVMPRNAGLTEDVTRRVEDFVVLLLLPMFFAYTGLQLDLGLLDRGVLWLLTGVLIAIAIVGKLFGAMLAARLVGYNWRESAVLGTLMNTRGLTELIVLNLALSKGVISSAVFAMMVLMALVTTFMAGPLLKLLDPTNSYGAPVAEELTESRELSRVAFPALPMPERSILLAAQSNEAVPALLELAEPMARTQPPRELILARLVRPPRGAGVRGALQSEKALVQRAAARLDDAARELVADGVAARPVAFASAHPGDDLARLAAAEEVDLVLVDGRRPLLGEPLPLVEIKPLLADAPCDVGVLVSREGRALGLGPGAPIVVPFGGAEHDWSALELGSWLSSATGATLKLLGVAASGDETADVQRRLGEAGKLVRDFTGVTVAPLVVDDVRSGVAGAGLLVVGLSERWQHEGLGETRSQLARSATSPVLFVRRGTRPGALAPRDEFSRFAWSSVGLTSPRTIE